MADNFGPLLRKWRNASDLTQEQLAEELRIALEQESYSKSDVSKWECGNKIPKEELVEELEKILSPPKGVLLRAAGYTSVEKEPSLKWQQIEHIRSLQELAKSVIESVPELIDFDNLENLDSVHTSLWQAFKKLNADPRWRSLAAHLGERAQELELMTSQIEPDLIPPWKKGLPIDPYKELVRKAWDLISDSDLWLVANSGDTREWEYYGLNQRCPWCPNQTSEPLNG